MAIVVLGPREADRMRRAGAVAAATLQAIGERLTPGVTTLQIDAWVREDTARRNGRPSQLGYKGFPAAVCTSVNEVVCHGIPSPSVVLRDGDIINVDVTTCVTIEPMITTGHPQVLITSDGWTAVFSPLYLGSTGHAHGVRADRHASVSR